MKLNDYQKQTWKTAKYPHAGENDIVALSYLGLGITGEAGEVAEKIKKILRDDKGEITTAARLGLMKELGDVLWYAARIADEIGLDLDAVAQQNLNKLADRLERGVIGGSGDER